MENAAVTLPIRLLLLLVMMERAQHTRAGRSGGGRGGGRGGGDGCSSGASGSYLRCTRICVNSISNIWSQYKRGGGPLSGGGCPWSTTCKVIRGGPGGSGGGGVPQTQ